MSQTIALIGDADGDSTYSLMDMTKGQFLFLDTAFHARWLTDLIDARPHHVIICCQLTPTPTQLGLFEKLVAANIPTSISQPLSAVTEPSTRQPAGMTLGKIGPSGTAR